VLANEFMKVWYKLQRDYKSHMEQSLAPDLTEAQLVVLEYIMNHEQVKPSDLIDYLATTPAAVTTLLDRMVKNELIVRQRNEQDRRIVWIRLTEKGRRAGEEGLRIRNAYIQRGLDRISRHGRHLLIYLLGRMAEGLEGRERSAPPEAEQPELKTQET